jgi:hypothetical protein
LLGKIVPPSSKVAVVAGMLMAEDHRKKAEGFSETFPKHCLGGQIEAVTEDPEDEEESFQKSSRSIAVYSGARGNLRQYSELPASVPRSGSGEP